MLNISKYIFNPLSLAIVITILAVPFASAIASKTDLGVIGEAAEDPILTLMLGKADVLDIPGNVADILVANPSIVDVMAVKSNRLYLVGVSLGDTNIIILDENGDILYKTNVHVQIDTEKVERMLDKLYPDEEVTIHGLTDQLVITGEVSTPSVANAISGLVAEYAAEVTEMEDVTIDEVITNMLSVRGEQQVMLRVKIIEASRSALKDLGLETNVTRPGANLTGTLSTVPALGLNAPQQLGVLALNYTTSGFGPLNFFARALEQNGILNTLAEPNLTAISGEEAGFLAGGEVPIPTQINQQGNLIYEFRPFGVSLNFRPIVLSHNRINLQLRTEVSTTTFDDNLNVGTINVPTFNVRRAETTVEIPSGGTLMIAGLLQSETLSQLTELPGVGSIPVLGDLVKSDTFERDESEVVVMITPYVVQPFAQSNADVENMPDSPEPLRDENRLTEVFGNNLRRVYGGGAPNRLMKKVGTFGYITD